MEFIIKQYTKEELSKIVREERKAKIQHIIESHNSMNWVECDELYFEDEDIAEEYFDIFRNGHHDEFNPISPEELLDYISDPDDLITEERLAEMVEELEEVANEEYQHNEDMQIYWAIVREGLGL